MYSLYNFNSFTFQNSYFFFYCFNLLLHLFSVALCQSLDYLSRSRVSGLCHLVGHSVCHSVSFPLACHPPSFHFCFYLAGGKDLGGQIAVPVTTVLPGTLLLQFCIEKELPTQLFWGPVLLETSQDKEGAERMSFPTKLAQRGGSLTVLEILLVLEIIPWPCHSLVV